MLAFDYASRRAILLDPGAGELSPHLYSICHPCAERLSPPRGWTLEDRRSEPVLFLDEPVPQQPAATTVGSTAPSAPDNHSKQLLFGSSS